MKGIVESSEWDGDSMVYTVRVFRPNHTDINVVGHEVSIVKGWANPAEALDKALADFADWLESLDG